jgi:hypothetical protein
MLKACCTVNAGIELGGPPSRVLVIAEMPLPFHHPAFLNIWSL